MNIEFIIEPKSIKNCRNAKLSNQLLKYPTEDLKNLITTKDLLNFWNEEREMSKDIVVNFLYRMYKQNINFFENLSTNDRKFYRIIDAMAERYFSIYRLLSYAFPKIKKKLPDCPKTSDELFIKIFEFERNRPIEIILENDYIEVNRSDSARYHRDMHRFISSNEFLSKKEEIKIQNNTPHYLKKSVVESPWYDILEIINTIKDSKISMLGRNYNSATEYLYESLDSWNNTRVNNSGYLEKSYTWKNQKLT